jgi:hypothetical protein
MMRSTTTTLRTLATTTALLLIAAAVSTSNAFVLDGLRSRLKTDLLELVTAGAPEDTVLNAVRNAERLATVGGAPTLNDPRLPGNWLMVWTTSDSIAGKTRPAAFRTRTPPEQSLDLENGRAVNAEYIWGVRSSVEAKLTPRTRNKVRVNFERFNVGPLKFTPDPERFKGELSVTYLDEDMRISRGDLGNAFILLRETTQRKEANEIWRQWRNS